MLMGEAEAVRRKISVIAAAEQEASAPEVEAQSTDRAKPSTEVSHVQEDVSDEDSGHLSDPEEELCRETRLKERVVQFKERYGVNDERTINKVLKLVSVLIGQYKLDDTDEYLDMITEAVTARGEADPLYIKTIQSRAFCLWKRYKYTDALKLFHEQERIMGPSAALCENIGHTYNSLGNYESAEKYFVQAMEMLKHGSFGNKGGIYLGLGLVRERLGKTKEALPILQQALAHYQDEYNQAGQQLDSSLIAKSHMSVAHAHENLGELDTATYHVREALRVFRKTVGNSSPLVANALGSLGRMLQANGDNKEADKVLRHALTLEVRKDAFHLETVFKLLNSIKELHTSGTNTKKGSLQELHALVLPLLGPIQEACDRVDQLEMVQKHTDDGTVAVFYKTAGELLMLAGEYQKSIELLNRAGEMLRQIEDFDCTSLIESVDYMSTFAKSQLHSKPQVVTAADAALGDGQTSEQSEVVEPLHEPQQSGGPMFMSMPPAHDATDLDDSVTKKTDSTSLMLD